MSWSSTTREILALYHDKCIINHNEILYDIKRYLNEYDACYEIECDDDINNNHDIIDIGEEFYVIPVFVILKLYLTHTNCSEVREVISWYLSKYHPSYKLLVKGKLQLSSIYGVMMNP